MASRNLPSDTPRLPKWIFLIADAALLGTAWFVAVQSQHPTEGAPLVAIVVCVAAAGILGAIPFVADYASRQDEALDNRQRALEVLASTVAGASEQVAIAANGIQQLAAEAEKNVARSQEAAKEILGAISGLQGALAAAARNEEDAAGKIDAAARKLAKKATELEEAAAAAVQARPPPPPAVAEPAPVIAELIPEIRPAVAPSDPPFEPDPVPEPEPPPPPPVKRTRKAAAAAPTVAAAPEPVPAPQPAEEPEPILTPEPERTLAEPAAPPPAEPEEPPAEPVESALSADGATRIIVTSYIGIGNRLFIRGEGAGLTWDQGVPLSFVSIGKWRWETNGASSTVRFKLYKNDQVECAALGQRTIEPGAQQELTASF